MQNAGAAENEVIGSKSDNNNNNNDDDDVHICTAPYCCNFRGAGARQCASERKRGKRLSLGEDIYISMSHSPQCVSYIIQNRQSCRNLEALPRQWSTVEVHKNISKWLHVVSSALLNTKVCVDARVPSRPCQVLVFTVGNVLTSSIITIFLCQAVVDKKNLERGSIHTTALTCVSMCA